MKTINTFKSIDVSREFGLDQYSTNAFEIAARFNAIATVAANLGIVFQESWFFTDSAKTMNIRNVIEYRGTNEETALIAEMVSEYGFDIVNKIFMTLYAMKREELGAEVTECQK